jgi:hypothetical protein
LTHSKKELKLAILSEDFKDSDILKIFLDTEVEKEDDITDIFGFLETHRPLVLKELKKKIH